MAAIWTYPIYYNPADFPGQYVLRKFRSEKGKVEAQKFCRVSNTIDGIRIYIPAGLTRLEPGPEDDKTIIEIWI